MGLVKICMMKFPSFIHLCTTLDDYQNLVIIHETKPASSHPKNTKRPPKNSHCASEDQKNLQP
jgi:hypothetical protein